MAIKLNMSKAYGRVEWVFVEEIMCMLGFVVAWIKLITLQKTWSISTHLFRGFIKNG